MKSTERFTQTVDDYVKYRPSYPRELLDSLRSTCQLSADTVIADIGSGTGIFTKLLLDEGYQAVYAVEPNQAMRQAAEQALAMRAGFFSIAGTAEASHLPPNSIDFISVAQAFHWMDPNKTRTEFKRILKAKGWVALIWNVRDITQYSITRAYEQVLMKYGIDYQNVSVEHYDYDKVKLLFAGQPIEKLVYEFKQHMDFTALKGRMDSASYAPKPGHPDYEVMIAELKSAFDQYQQNGTVEFVYQTVSYVGQL